MYLIIGLLAGALSGMGLGGGVILIPALTYLGMEQLEAQNMNLLYFIPTAIVSIIIHKKNNNIETKVLKSTIIFALIGAIIGVFLAVRIETELLKKIFGVFLILVGIYEMFIAKAGK